MGSSARQGHSPSTLKALSLRLHCLSLILLLPYCLCIKVKSFQPGDNVLYRGDGRPPNHIRAAGGFQPSNSKAGPTSFSIYEHTRPPRAKESTQYVSTSKRLGVAAMYAATSSRDNKRAAPSWVYFVRPTLNCIDAVKTLGAYAVDSNHAEVSALGGIRWEQVLGWILVAASDDVEDIIRAGGRDAPRYLEEAVQDFELTLNEDYNTALDRATATGSVPQLAGFPWGHEAWSRMPWMNFPFSDNFPLLLHATAYMETCKDQIRWQGQFPLFERLDMADNAFNRVQRVTSAAKRLSAEALAEERPIPAARKAMNAVRKIAKAKAWLSRLAKVIDDHSILNEEMFLQAYQQWQDARKEAAKTYWRDQTLRVQLYRQQASAMKANMHEQAGISEHERDTMVEMARAFMDHIDNLLRQVEFGRNLHASHVRLMKGALESGPRARAVASASLPWMRFREGPIRAVLRELGSLECERQNLESSFDKISMLAEEGKMDTADFLANIDRVRVSPKGVSGPDDVTSPGFSWVEVALEVVLEVISLLPTPAAPALNVLKWARRAWIASKIARRARKIAKGVKISAPRHSASLRNLAEASETLEKLLKGTKTISSDKPGVQRKWDSLNDMFQHLDPVSAPQAREVHINSASIDDLLRELETIRVPTQRPVFTQEITPLEELLQKVDQLGPPTFEIEGAEVRSSPSQLDKVPEPALVVRSEPLVRNFTDNLPDDKGRPEQEGLIDLVLYKCSCLVGQNIGQEWSGIDELISLLDNKTISDGYP